MPAADSFEAELKAGRDPSIEAQLAAESDPSMHGPLLMELIGLEADYHRRRGRPVDLAAYVARFPAHREPVERALGERRVLGPGDSIGRYEVLGLAGSGGMGEVYRARDRVLERTVALKVIQRELAGDPSVHQRFEQEARALAAQA